MIGITPAAFTFKGIYCLAPPYCLLPTILLVQGTRKIPVQYAKRIVGNKQYGGARQYIPLKVNAAGVMPIIFAQAIMFIPITFIGFSNVNDAGGFLHAFTDHTSFWYNFVFAVMIILFTYFYTAITINPTQMAEDMKRNNGFIPGIKPGKKTAEYIDDIMSRITLPGSFFLALVAIMPAFAGVFGVQAGFAQFFFDKTLSAPKIPSFAVKPGQLIGVRERSKSLEVIANSLAGFNHSKYAWLEWDEASKVGKMLHIPERADIPENIKEHLIVELYSK